MSDEYEEDGFEAVNGATTDETAAAASSEQPAEIIDEHQPETAVAAHFESPEASAAPADEMLFEEEATAVSEPVDTTATYAEEAAIVEPAATDDATTEVSVDQIATTESHPVTSSSSYKSSPPSNPTLTHLNSKHIESTIAQATQEHEERVSAREKEKATASSSVTSPSHKNQPLHYGLPPLTDDASNTAYLMSQNSQLKREVKSLSSKYSNSLKTIDELKVQVEEEKERTKKAARSDRAKIDQSQLSNALKKCEIYKKANEVLRTQINTTLNPEQYSRTLNKLSEAEALIATLQEENKTLQNVSRRLTSDLKSIEDQQGELPTRLASQLEEIRHMKEKIQTYKLEKQREEKRAIKQQAQMVNWEEKYRKSVAHTTELEKKLREFQQERFYGSKEVEEEQSLAAASPPPAVANIHYSLDQIPTPLPPAAQPVGVTLPVIKSPAQSTTAASLPAKQSQSTSHKAKRKPVAPAVVASPPAAAKAEKAPRKSLLPPGMQSSPSTSTKKKAAAPSPPAAAAPAPKKPHPPTQPKPQQQQQQQPQKPLVITHTSSSHKSKIPRASPPTSQKKKPAASKPTPSPPAAIAPLPPVTSNEPAEVESSYDLEADYQQQQEQEITEPEAQSSAGYEQSAAYEHSVAEEVAVVLAPPAVAAAPAKSKFDTDDYFNYDDPPTVVAAAPSEPEPTFMTSTPAASTSYDDPYTMKPKNKSGSSSKVATPPLQPQSRPKSSEDSTPAWLRSSSSTSKSAAAPVVASLNEEKFPEPTPPTQPAITSISPRISSPVAPTPAPAAVVVDDTPAWLKSASKSSSLSNPAAAASSTSASSPFITASPPVQPSPPPVSNASVEIGGRRARGPAALVAQANQSAVASVVESKPSPPVAAAPAPSPEANDSTPAWLKSSSTEAAESSAPSWLATKKAPAESKIADDRSSTPDWMKLDATPMKQEEEMKSTAPVAATNDHVVIKTKVAASTSNEDDYGDDFEIGDTEFA